MKIIKFQADDNKQMIKDVQAENNLILVQENNHFDGDELIFMTQEEINKKEIKNKSRLDLLEERVAVIEDNIKKGEGL